MSTTKLTWIFVSVLSSYLVSCGSEPPPAKPRANGALSADANSDSHSVFVNVGSTSGLNLRQVAVDTATYDIKCDQYEQLSLTDPVSKVFDGSTSCTVELQSFSLETGRLYVPRSGGEFTDFAPGEVAIFDSGDLTLYVMIETQLPSTVNAPADVSYKFSEINNFDDLEAQKKVEHGILTMLSGDFAVGLKVKPPIYDNNSIEFVGECMNEAVEGTDLNDGTCLGDALNTIQLAFAPYPANTDRVTLAALTANAENLESRGAEFVPAEAGVTNGGFRVTLPFDDADLQDRILILRAQGSSSYLFGKIIFSSNN